MPYKIFQSGNKWEVWKVDAENKRTEKVGTHPSRTKAKKHKTALDINVSSKEAVMNKLPQTTETEELPDAAEMAYPVYDMMDRSEVPYGVYSFADLDQADQAEELLERLEERTSQFYTLFWRIWNNSEIPIGEKTSAWNGLFSEFIQVFQSEISTEEAVMEELETLTENLSGSIIRVSESDKSNGDARQPLKLDIIVIEPGWGNAHDNHYYPKETLRRDSAGVFKGAKMYVTDHRPDEKSVRTEVGVIEDIIRFSETGAPIGRVKIWDADFAEDIRNRNKIGELGTLECSILAKGNAVKGKVEGRDANIVEAIIPSKYTNVDFVTSAGAGGRALYLVENEKEVDVMPVENENIEEEVSEVQPEPVAEAQEVLLHENAEETEPEETETEIQEVEPSILSEADVLTVLSNSKLPKISIDRLLKGNYLSEAELLTTVQAEKDYIKSLVGSGEPKALGETAPVVEQLTEAEILEDHNKRINRVIFGN